MGTKAIKCHKCRHVLLEDITTSMNNKSTCDIQMCNSYDVKKFIYLLEDKLPSWIKVKIEDEQWTKGKIHCGNCGCRVGSFDFVSGRKCDCRTTVLPPVHFVSSQVDKPLHIT